MGRDQEIQEHPVFQSLEEAISSLNNLDAIESQEHLEKIERIRALLSYVNRRLDATDTQFLWPAVLDTAHQQLNQLTSEFDLWNSQSESVNLDNADNHASAFLRTISTIPDLRTPSDAEGLRESASSYRRSIGQLLGQTERELSALEEKITSLSDRIDTHGEDLKTQIDEVKRLQTALSTEMEAQKGRVDTLINEQQQNFSTRQEERKTQFESWLQEREEDVGQAQTKLEEKIAEVVSNSQEKAKELLDAIEERRDTAVDIVDVIRRVGTAWGFGSYAEKERRLANVWRWIAITTLVLATLLGAAIVFALWQDRPSVGERALRTVVTVPVFVLAGYAMKQSADHRRVERRNQQLELEVNTLDTYIQPLTEDQQRLIKEYMALRIYGHIEEPDTEDRIPQRSARQVLDLLRRNNKSAKASDESDT